MKYIIIFIGLLLISFSSKAQSLEGTVVEEIEGTEWPLIGASVYWLGSTIGASTDQEGKFKIDRGPEHVNLVISFVGYRSDTLEIKNNRPIKVKLLASQDLGNITVEKKQQATFHSWIDPKNMQTISSKELLKAACCNLSESFETNASVDVAYSDAVSGAKQIRMLGLEGIYSQILTENLPGIRGLSTAYGLGSIPGPWMQSIQVSKGAASVLNGYESITGQINVEYHKPETHPPLYVNAYMNNRQRMELNLIAASRIGKKWSTMTSTHASMNPLKIDGNQDGFLDVPNAELLNVFHRWKFVSDKNFRMQFGVKAMTSTRIGGQDESQFDTAFYKVGVNIDHIETFTKTGWIFPEKPWKSVGIMTSAVYHDQWARFGSRTYSGLERHLYGNFIYATRLINSMHSFKSGFSYIVDDYNESFQDSNFRRTESVPGVFTEYTWKPSDRFTFVPGLRADYHEFEEMVVIPRLHMRAQLALQTTFRLSAGRGYRRPNAIAENLRYLASSRALVVTGDLKPEIAWNYGVGLQQNFKIADREGSVILDVYRTEFENQVVVDLDQDVHEVNFYNLSGSSYANSAQIEVSYELRPRLDVKAAFKMEDVRVDYVQGNLKKPFVPDYRALFNWSYKSKYEKWAFDHTTLFTGPSRIPGTLSNPIEFQADASSPAYMIMNAQITRFYKKWDWYLGAENLLGYLQDDPIIASEDPFGPNFDASLIWGPLHGPVVYLGMRLTIDKK